MSLTPISAAGPTPQPTIDQGAAQPPQPTLTPNPYGIPDQVVQSNARSDANRLSGDLSAALQKTYNFAIGDDLHAAGDPSHTAADRLLHGGAAALTVLTLPGGPEALGLKLVAKQTVKDGMEQLTYHALESASGKAGKLIVQDARTVSADEAKVASKLVARGHEVTILAPSKSQYVKTPDFLVDGKPTELKTISNAKPDSVGASVTSTIKDATKQARNVVIDARGQAGLTKAKAESAVLAAFRKLPNSALTSVRLFGQDGKEAFELTMTRK